MRKQKQVTGALACSLSWAGWGQAPPLNGLQVGEEPWVGPERWLRWSAHPSCRSVCGMVHSTLFWLTILQSWQLGFSSFCILLIICPNCACMRAVILIPYSFFAFCLWKRHLSRWEHWEKGSRSQLVLISLRMSLVVVHSQSRKDYFLVYAFPLLRVYSSLSLICSISWFWAWNYAF